MPVSSLYLPFAPSLPSLPFLSPLPLSLLSFLVGTKQKDNQAWDRSKHRTLQLHRWYNYEANLASTLSEYLLTKYFIN